MSTLHTLNKSNADPATIESCCNSMGEEDVLILIEDGVYNATACLHASIREKLSSGSKIYVRNRDIKARGIEAQILSGFTPVDDSEWLGLCIAHQPIVSWY